MQIAFFLHRFPSVSETFILRQITGLLDLSHDVHIYSERRPTGERACPEFIDYNLAARTTYLDAEMPAESGEWSMPVWPIAGETWLPGAEEPIPNSDRVVRAAPVFRRCFEEAPQLAIESIDPDHYGGQALSLEALYHLHSLLKRPAQYDILHAHFGPVANNFRFARALWNAPFIATFHGYDFSMIPRTHGRDVYHRLFRDADAVTAISDYAKAQLEELGCAPEKLQVTQMGVRLDEFPFRARSLNDGEPVRILSVGRLVEKKGLGNALRAVAFVNQRNAKVHYDIIGHGPLRSRLEQHINELNLGSIVTMWGAQDNAFVRSRMADSHLFLLPSVTADDGDQEGVPVSLMEAQASGLPVLSTRHSGIPELVVDGKSGVLVPEGDSEALASSLLQLIKHPNAWARMGHEGRKAVAARFDVAKLTQDLVTFYEKLCLSFRNTARSKALSTR